MVAPDRTTRDANLDAIQAAAEEWFTKELARLDNETRFLRTVLQSRPSGFAVTNLAEMSELVQDEINAFFFVG